MTATRDTLDHGAINIVRDLRCSESSSLEELRKPLRSTTRHPSRAQLNRHLRLIATKTIHPRTTLLMQTVIFAEYNSKLQSLHRAAAADASASSSEDESTTSAAATAAANNDAAYRELRIARRRKLKAKRIKMAKTAAAVVTATNTPATASTTTDIVDNNNSNIEACQ